MAKNNHTFLNEVTNQISSKEAKKYIADELSYPLKESKKTWLEKGLTEEQAEEKAIEQMGSPIQLGKQMNKLHKPKIDWLLLSLLGTTLIIGFLPLFSLGYMEEGNFIAYNKIIITLLGGAAAIGLMLMDYRKWKKQGWLFYSLGILMLLLLQFFSNTMINGLPTLRISMLTIESLMAVPFFYLGWAAMLDNERLRVWQFILLFSIPILLFISLPTKSTTVIYVVMVIVMLMGSKFTQKAVVTIWSVSAFVSAAIGFVTWQILQDYQKVRLLAFFNPKSYADQEGYIILRVRELLSKAGWFGASIKKEFIPEAHTNFVFVSFTYYYGWLFAIALVLILALFVARMITVTFKVKDSYGKLLLIGAISLYTVQFVINIGMILGLFPMISMSLPFISYGLMPTLFNAFLIGSVLSVFRRKDLISTRNI